MVVRSGMGPNGAWKLAPALVALEDECNRVAPKRSKASDGSIGDADHAARESDHNPDIEPGPDWVDALDITYDPENGMNIHARFRAIALRVIAGLEKRVSYMISNDEIFSKKNGVWAWRPYTGKNSHRHHGHMSVNDEHRHDASPWFGDTPQATPIPEKPVIQEDEEMRPILYVCEGKGFMNIAQGVVTTLTPDEFKAIKTHYEAQGIKYDQQNISARRWEQIERQLGW